MESWYCKQNARAAKVNQDQENLDINHSDSSTPDSRNIEQLLQKDRRNSFSTEEASWERVGSQLERGSTMRWNFPYREILQSRLCLSQKVPSQIGDIYLVTIHDAYEVKHWFFFSTFFTNFLFNNSGLLVLGLRLAFIYLIHCDGNKTITTYCKFPKIFSVGITNVCC